MRNCTEPEKPVANRSQVEGDHRLLGVVEKLLLDCHNSTPSRRSVDFARDIKTLRVRFAHEGVPFITSTLPSLFDAVISALEGNESSYPGWKLMPGRKCPCFCNWLIRPILERPNDARTVIYVRNFYQLTYAFKKLKGPYTKAVLNKQLVEFCETDYSLSLIDYDDYKLQPIINRASSIVASVIKDLNPFDEAQAGIFKPRPGPGATNSPVDYSARFRPHTVYSTLSEIFDYEEWFHPPVANPASNRDLRTCLGNLRYDVKTAGQPTSRLKFVHKTYGKARSICIEEHETQYFQQAIASGIRYAIEHSPVTAGFINFEDQSVNGNLARIHSGTKGMSTIDMSEASDRVSRILVEKLFWSNEPLLTAMMACSTETITIPDTINFISELPIYKFAPMGSALCFPVMSLVHFALITAITELYGTKSTLYPGVYVYGDDIVVATDNTQPIFTWLPEFGMKLNVLKSFSHSRFRESCGVHAYDGVDITPTRFKYLVTATPTWPALISLLSNESDLYEKGFKETARYLCSVFQSSPDRTIRSLGYVGKNSPCLGYRRKMELRLYDLSRYKRKWNADWMCFTYKAVCMVPIGAVHTVKEREAYLRWHLMSPEGSSNQVCPVDPVLTRRHRWVTASQLTLSK